MTAFFLRRGVSAIAIVSAALAATAFPAAAEERPIVAAQPDPGPGVAPYVVDPREDPPLSNEAMAALARAKIKYVFIVFNENHSFDNEYGTFPGVDGLYSDGLAPRPPDKTPGFVETYTDASGAKVTVTPFLIGAKENATFVDSVDHSHKGLAAKLDVVDGAPRMDGFAADEYAKYAKPGNNMAQAQGMQFARLVMSHVDCDTIPFFWNWANRFAIFDRIFATEDTPSTPNAIAMLAGQAGETQWVEHAGDAKTPLPMSGTINGKTYAGTGEPQRTPIVNDPNPFWGSEYDATAGQRQPTSPGENYAAANIAENLTFASVPLTAMAREIVATTEPRPQPRNRSRRRQGRRAVHPGPRPARRSPGAGTRTATTSSRATSTAARSHANYVAHHNGAQYFGYIANNPLESANLSGEGDFFADIAAHRLPKDGGVFYVRGGFRNIRGATPPIQNPNYPNPAGLTADEFADDRQGRSRATTIIRAIPTARSARRWTRASINAIAGDPDVVEPERDHHHLRRVGRLLRSRAAAHPLVRSRRACRSRAASACRCC